MKQNHDVIIIGSGIIGTAISLALSRKGLKVHAVDSLPAAGYGSTSGSCAIIRPYYSTVDGSAMAYESHFYWKQWESFLGSKDERGMIRYVDCGALVMKTEGNGYLQHASGMMDEIGAPYTHLTAEEILQRFPQFCLDSFSPAKLIDDDRFGQSNGNTIDGAVLFHSAGYVTDPQLATHNLQCAAEGLGATFRFNTAVCGIEKHSGRVAGVQLESGETLYAPVVVNAAGPHSYKINRMAGVEEGMNIKTRALRHEVAHVPAPAGLDFENHGCVVSDNDTAAYLRPEHGNQILIGSEDPECDDRQWVDPDTFDHNFTASWRTLVMRAAQRIPRLGIPNQAKGVVELYDVSDDWIPIYDRSDLPGFYMAIGTSGNQFKNAPIVGELMAELIQASEDGRNQDDDPVDFHLRNIDRTISSGFYSRLRKINENSSFSVLG